MAGGELGVDDAEHAREFAALHVEPGLEDLDLVDGAARAIGDEEHPVRPGGQGADDDTLGPLPAGHARKFDVDRVFPLARWQQHGGAIGFIEPAFDQVGDDFPAAGASRAKNQINERFLSGRHGAEETPRLRKEQYVVGLRALRWWLRT